MHVVLTAQSSRVNAAMDKAGSLHVVFSARRMTRGVLEVTATRVGLTFETADDLRLTWETAEEQRSFTYAVDRRRPTPPEEGPEDDREKPPSVKQPPT